MRTATLGEFTLRFEDAGKLADLAAAGRAPFLADAAHREELAPGRWFEPRGWDECFPTIEACGDSPVMGDLVWAAPRLELRETSVAQSWEWPALSAVRRFTAPAARRLRCDFTATRRGATPLPFLWASHALFRCAGLRRVAFAGGPVLEDFALDGSSRKTFVENRGPLQLTRADGEMRLETDQPFWGLWLNRGGWPAGRPAGIGCIGLEATNARADCPSGAVLAPGRSFAGQVTLEVCT